MKKELVALLLLLLILAGNIWNQRRLDRLTAGLDRLTEEAFASARDGRGAEETRRTVLKVHRSGAV